MSKKTCFMIFIAAIVAIMVSFILKFHPVTGEVSAVFSAMQNPYIAVAASVLSLLLIKQRWFWLMILGCAVLTAIAVQLLVTGETLAVAALIYKIVAFVVYAYLIVLMRFML